MLSRFSFTAVRAAPVSTRAFGSTVKDNDVVIASVARTPIAKIGGSFASLTGPQLAAVAVKEAVKRAGIDSAVIEEAYLGNVISAGQGQAPTRQAVIYAGLPLSVDCTTVNKVCASGMKSAMMAAQAIQTGYRGVMLAGGFESMSNVPYYNPAQRAGSRLGHAQLLDGLIHDGLWDVYNNQHMGMCGEACSAKYGLTREMQDDYAASSYKRSAAAWKAGHFKWEVVPVEIAQKKGEPKVISVDEEFSDFDEKKLRSARPAFKKDGTVTAGNASSLDDGAAAMILMSGARARELGVKPLARIRGYGDAARDPVEFTVAPSDAVPRALKHAGVAAGDVQYHEINEAFSVVALANAQLLKLDMDRVNVFGGAVSLGHPIGCSGARIMITLLSVLRSKDATIGCASICNGGGAASAVVLERLN